MKIIKHSYSADLDWLEHFAEQFEAKIDGNFIIVPEKINSGVRYVLDCDDGIIAYYADIVYNVDIEFITKHTKKDFIGLYYSLNEGEITIQSNHFTHHLGRWLQNISIIDSMLDTNLTVKAGTPCYVLSIFIKKSTLESLMKKNNVFLQDIHKITDPKKNTFIRFDRMSNESYHLLTELRQQQVGGPIFDMSLKGTVHLLISNYLRKMSTDRLILSKVNETDLSSIVGIQMFLIENIEGHFPSITLMAEKANMSESKFKTLFKKITGSTPNTFFMDNKILRSKELLEEQQLTVYQISDQLHFANSSHFAAKFKDYFKFSPKEFMQQL